MSSRIFAAAILGNVHAVAAQLGAGDAELLLSKGNVKGATIMHVAAMHGHTELVSWLAHNHPRAQYATDCESHGRTPLHLAALSGEADVVNELLKLSDIDPMCVDHNMHTPLLLAALNGHTSVISKILEASNNQRIEQLAAANRHGHTALHLAVLHAHVDTVQSLLKNLTSEQAVIDQLTHKDHMGSTALHSAASVGRADIVEEIFKMCKDSSVLGEVNNTGWSPLHVASRLGHAEIVNLICEKLGSCVNTTTHNLECLTPLHLAANNGHDAVVDALLRQDELRVGNCDALRRTALHYAARQGHTSVVDKLLTSSKSNSLLVNATDANGLTALHLAAREGHEQVVHILLKEGANVNAKTESSLISKSLLDTVLCSNAPHETIVDPMILEADCWHISQMTPLHLAAKNGHMAVVRELLKRRDVNIKALDGHGLMAQDWAEVREVKKDFLVCLEQHPRSAGETSARVPKKKVLVLREEMMKWEKMVAMMPPSTFHSFQTMQYTTETCEDLGKFGKQDGKVSDLKAFRKLRKEDTRDMNSHSTPYDGDIDTAESLQQGIYEIAGQQEQSGNTPLHVAVKRSNKKDVEDLLKCRPMDKVNVKNSEGHTPLALAFKNNDVEIFKLILQNSEKVEDDLDEMLKTAMTRKWVDMSVLLAGDARTHTDGGISVNFPDEASDSHPAEKGLLDILLRRTTIKERLLQERKEHLDSAGAMLVIAALIASITYQGGLEPPQGKYNQAQLLFDWLNAIAFYSSVATTIAVASGSLPIRHMYELINARDPMQMSRGISCVLLIVSSTCVVWAYATAGFSKGLDNRPFSFGNGVGATATTLFLFWFLKHYIKLYKPFCDRSSHSRSNGQQNEGYICTL